MAQSGGVYIENPLPNWELEKKRTDHLCPFVGVAGFFLKRKEAFCIYTVQFLGKESIIFSPLLWIPLFLYFASTMVVPFVGFTLLLSLCYGFVPFVMGLCSAFFVFLCLFFSVSGEYCYSVLLFLCSGSLFLCFVCFSLCSVPLFYVFCYLCSDFFVFYCLYSDVFMFYLVFSLSLLFLLRVFCFLLFGFRCFSVFLIEFCYSYFAFFVFCCLVSDVFCVLVSFVLYVCFTVLVFIFRLVDRFFVFL